MRPAIYSEPFRRWILPRYTTSFSPETIHLSTEKQLPVIKKPTQVLVKIKASSINPIDIEIANGFGSTGLGAARLLRQLTIDCEDRITFDKFPIVLGRDFSGTIVAKGNDVDNFKTGQDVIGVIPPEMTEGSHATHIVCDTCRITEKPDNLSHTEAACLPYAGLTAYSAIHRSAGLNNDTSLNKRVLLLGATGGVGIIAGQLLTSYGAIVTATASTDAVDWLKSHVPLVDSIIDYKNDPTLSAYNNYFDVVINAASMASAPQLQSYALRTLKAGGTYVTLTIPLLSNLDKYGYLAGSAKSIVDIINDSVTIAREGRKKLRWSLFYPSASGLTYIAQQSSLGRIQPVISETVDFGHALQLYQSSLDGHARGKRVLRIDNDK